ncbi:MAG: alkaline phosphatase family protein [Chloroflexota bacterium]
MGPAGACWLFVARAVAPEQRSKRGVWLIAAVLALAIASCAGRSTLTAGTTEPAGATTEPAPTAPVASPTEVPAWQGLGHVFLIVLENRGYSEVMTNPDAAYIHELVARYAVADQYRASGHPSLPNYLALIGGDTFGIQTDCTSCIVDAPNLADELEQQGRSWKSYQEDLPSACFLGEQADGYVQRHNPFLYFQSIRSDPARCQRVVPLDQLTADLQSGSVPDLAWVTPNVNHDMHDRSIAEGDHWLAGFVPRILDSSAWQQNGLLVVVWDESSNANSSDGGHVLALFITPQGSPGARSPLPASHYSLLRTLEEGWGLGYLGHTADPDVHALADLLPGMLPQASTAAAH